MGYVKMVFLFASSTKIYRVVTGKTQDGVLRLWGDKKKTLYDLIDTYIRDAKGRKTYAA